MSQNLSVVCSLCSWLHGSPHGLPDQLPTESLPQLREDPRGTRPEVGVSNTNDHGVGTWAPLFA